jgi:glycosyltransferase involved in cell wall biosynthesis
LPRLIAFRVLALLVEPNRRDLAKLACKVELRVQVQRRLGGRGGADVLRPVCCVVRAHLPELENDVTLALRARREWAIPGRQVAELGLVDAVRFMGPLAPERLREPLSAADVFVLSTRNEGWANVFLEAMACGIPVVTTDVGGNSEVVCRPELGSVVPFGDQASLRESIEHALGFDWDAAAIRRYAEDNTWDLRVDELVRLFEHLHAGGAESNGSDRVALS